MYTQMTFMDLTSATSLPGSADGALPCDSPDGPTPSLSGQEVVHASPLQTQGCGSESTMIATYGRNFSGSYESDALQQSLENRLRAKLPLNGLMEYSMTWKKRITPAQRQICALRASRHPISGKEFTGWPTPQSREWKSWYVFKRDQPWNRQGKHQLHWMHVWAIRNGWNYERAWANPDFSRRLMGYPKSWDDCAATATPSSRRSRRTS